MRKQINISIAVIAILFYSSCEDIFEEDITNDQITIISPVNDAVIEGNTVQFLWNTAEGVSQYTVQVYDGSFLVLDTLVESPPFTNVFSSNDYQWRIKGENDAYETPYTFPTNFTVVSSSNLENQNVVLNSPSDNLYTNNTSILCTWSAIETATSYDFELRKASNAGDETIFVMNDLTETSLSLDGSVLTEDAEYSWFVKAKNESSETSFFSRTFFLDTTVPNTPSLINPIFEEEFELIDMVDFTWNFGTDPGNIASEITSLFEISATLDFTTIIESREQLATTASYLFSTAGTYYWRVQGTDAAGNVGDFNVTGKLIVNE